MQHLLSILLSSLWLLAILPEAQGQSARLAADILPGSASSRPFNLVSYQQQIYFGAPRNFSLEPDTSELPGLYRFDPATQQADSLSPLGDPEAVLDGKVYGLQKIEYISSAFFDIVLRGFDFYVYDPVEDATRRIARLPPVSSGVNIREFTSGISVVGGKLYFRQFDATESVVQKVYAYDPATDELQAVYTGRFDGNGINYGIDQVIGDRYYFSGIDEIFEVNAITGQVRAVANNVVSRDAALSFEGKLYYIQEVASGLKALKVYDPVTETNTQVAPLDVLGSFNIISSIIGYQGTLYLASTFGGQRSGLYASNLATGETQLLYASDITSQLILVEGKICFTRSASGINQFVAFDTASKEATLFAELSAQLTINSDYFSGPEVFTYYTVLGGKLYFNGNDGARGDELYRYDALTNEVSLAADINPGSMGSFPEDIVVFNNDLYFTAFRPETGTELYTFDPGDIPVKPTVVSFTLINTRDNRDVAVETLEESDQINLQQLGLWEYNVRANVFAVGKEITRVRFRLAAPAQQGMRWSKKAGHQKVLNLATYGTEQDTPKITSQV